MAKPVLYGTFARACGVTTASVSIAAQKSLRPARVRSPSRRDRYLIDVEHPAAIAYHRKHYATATPLADLAGIDDMPPPPDVDFGQFSDWSLARVVGEYGTDERFKTWLSATKILVEIHAKNLQTLDRERRTIDRDLVRQHIFGAINDGNQRLLVDAPKSIARRVSAHAKSEGTIEDVEKMIRAEISKHLRAAQLAAVAGLAAEAGPAL